MIIDARSLSPEETLETHVCIIGSGPSGLTIAREFANQNFQVAVLESGGFEFDPEIQSLSDGNAVGDAYPVVSSTRLRQFGGTSHTWEGQNGYQEYGFRCLPLDEIDFEQRDWLPYSGWPFTKKHLDPFYERAHQVCQIGPYAYKPEDWEDRRAVRLPFKSDRIGTSMSQYAPRYPFTEEYPRQIRQTDNITTIIYGTVVEIVTDESNQTVTSLRIAASKDKQFWLKAKIFILATGGLENARLLLASNQQQTLGLGNQNDVVGRYFMDRPILSCSLIPYDHRLLEQTALYDIYRTKGIPVMARVRLSEELMRQEHILNNGAQLFPRPQERQRKATLALRSMILAIRDRKPLQDITKNLSTVLSGSDYILAAGFWAGIRKIPALRRGDWSYLPYEKMRFSQFEIFYQLEQAPDPNNRITLSAEKDFLGQNKVEIQWRLNPIDIQNAIRVQEIWAEEFDKAGLGKLEFANKRENWKFENLAMHHHMGTTRMNNDPKQGVVDANCKVHGVSNLFVAGSSVFPTAGYSNPTLTIIALSLRLADHIKTLI
ncbi:GMC oxidoreductase [Pseudanabaena yagii]|uniref:GMC family oxidoreductase n=1 Tax=Pseudanabaena yagii GIHE-NHR1 TaxID=2722753 RepID=A0ABX1LYZ6_9CYAN|nr:GMC family oxidoreductase [Pseudanabaena yagii]NMF60571.1 GMC family oxidoreductase [Pseudanabaena yagii GIHE-NHR1]